MSTPYDAEIYWSRVGREVAKREGPNFVAGDDNPYFRYKRAKFLRRFLDTLDVDGKTVLEVGFGPGGNLKRLAEHRKPARLLGADIAQPMVDLARSHLEGLPVELSKIDGHQLPYTDQSIDLTYTVTVLQHNTNEVMLRSIVNELGRVTRSTVVLMEDLGDRRDLNSGGRHAARHLRSYQDLMGIAGFELVSTRFLNTLISRTWMEMAQSLYSRIDRRPHQEGEPFTLPLRWLIGAPMVVTKWLDDRYPEQQQLAQMTFQRRL